MKSKPIFASGDWRKNRDPAQNRHYEERFDFFRRLSYSSMRRSYSRYVEAFTGSRRLIFSIMRLPNPCRISLRMPNFLIVRPRERLDWISGSRVRLALRVYSIGVWRMASRSSPSSHRRSTSLPIRWCLPPITYGLRRRPRVFCWHGSPSGPRLFDSG